MSRIIKIRVNKEMERLIREIGEAQLEDEFIPEVNDGPGAKRTNWEPGMFTWSLRKFKEEQATLEDQIEQKKEQEEEVRQERERLERQKEKRDLRREKSKVETNLEGVKTRKEELKNESFKTREEVRNEHIEKLLSSGDWDSRQELLDKKEQDIEEMVTYMHNPKTEKKQELENLKDREQELENRYKEVKEDLESLE